MALKDLKFLSLDGLTIVVNNIKQLIATEAAKTPIDTFDTTYTATDATLTVKQAGYTAKTSKINTANSENAGLMSAADKTKLDGIATGAQANVIEGIVVRAEGDTDSAIAMTTLVDGKKLVIDNLAEISETTPTGDTAVLKDKKLAPTAKAVRDYVTKVKTSLSGDVSGLTGRMDTAETNISTLQTNLSAEVTRSTNKDNDLQTAIDTINNTSTGILATAKTYTNDEVSKENQRALGVEAGLQNAINDINNATSGILATAKTYANGLVDTEKAARETADNDIIADLDNVEAFLGALSDNNSKAANVYNKTEANTAIAEAVAAVKKEILTGESTDAIGTAYDTLLEISNWIGSHGTEATNLTGRVAENEKDIKALQDKDTEILNTIGSGYSTTNTVASAITTLQNNLDDEVDRATNKENELNTAITNEATRADGVEKKIASDLAKEIGERENGDSNLQSNINTLSSTVTANDNAINTKVNALKYVTSIEDLACDNVGKLTITYNVNNDTNKKNIVVGYIIQESEIDALFGITN